MEEDREAFDVSLVPRISAGDLVYNQYAKAGQYCEVNVYLHMDEVVIGFVTADSPLYLRSRRELLLGSSLYA